MRYTRFWRNKFLTTEAKSLEDIATGLENAKEELDEMIDTGKVTYGGGAEDDYALLVTTDPDVARKYGFAEDDNDNA